MPQKKFIFRFKRAPGDTMMLTALVRDLKLTYGEDVLIDVRASFPDIWRHNPYLTSLSEKDKSVTTINFSHGKKSADRASIGRTMRGDGNHYLTAFHTAFTERTGIPVELLFSKADLHLTEEEKAVPLVGGRYGVVIAGGKTDITNKIYPTRQLQQVVNRLRELGLVCVQEGTTKRFHSHPPLTNVLNLIGQTSIRDLSRNIWHADFVITPCSLPMHIAAALEKPCVVLLGGREEVAYNSLGPGDRAGPFAEQVRVPNTVLHTIGQLDCCRTRGCWLRRVVALPDKRKDYNKSLCKHPDLSNPDEPVARCQSMISPESIVAAVMSYVDRGFIPPIGLDRRAAADWLKARHAA
jgi:ADP-heptose:LPS heptosyltransferase